MIRVIFYDRLDNQFTVFLNEGTNLMQFLLSKHIPLDSVIVRKNGNICYEDFILHDNDNITIEMVRAYHLLDFIKKIGISFEEPCMTTTEPVLPFYEKKVMWFSPDGWGEIKKNSISKECFPVFLEEIFASGIIEKQLLMPNDKIGLALSGGRDSLSLLYLLAKTKNKLPKHTLTCVTVCGLSKPLDFSIAQEATNTLNIPHVFIQVEELCEIFGLKGNIEEALDAIYQKYDRLNTINSVHAFMRTGVENYFRKQGITKIAYGLHNEDLLSSLIRSIVNGFQFGESFYQKEWGQFKIIYPLWPITKKELTLYLEATTPAKHSAQGSPTLYDRGGYNRDIQYFLADTIQTLWPGFSYHAFEGYKELFNKTLIAVKHRVCANCNAIFVSHIVSDMHAEKYCHLCDMLNNTAQLRKNRIVT